MKPIKSPLILVDFAILECQYSFNPSDDKEKEFSNEIFDQYSIDIDYSISEYEKLWRVFMTIDINNSDKPLDGYSMFIKAAGIFKFSEDTPESEINNLGASAISLTVNNIRSFIMNFTGCCPFGRYIFPSIDLNDILAQHLKKTREEEKPPIIVEDTKSIMKEKHHTHSHN